MVTKISKKLASLTYSRESFRESALKKFKEKVWFALFGAVGASAVLIVLFLLTIIFINGFEVISLEFLIERPLQQMTEGGIFPAILGTFYLSVLTLLFSLPIGISAAIYLHEWAGKGWFVRLIRLSIRNLAGIPSIVYGLFGLALFASGMGFGSSLLSASLTLSLMTLPIVITSSEEALKGVPNNFRQAALSLGATRWETIKLQVLPYALPGMATGSILGLARAAGETAPIILTGAAYYLPYLPESVFDRFMALPYHLYILATQHSDISTVRPIAFGTALVLILIVLTVNSVAILIRVKIRKNKIW
ncbi:phosphate ABC transporter permease PstA [Natranaerobius thermophilus]|uniref:Phosphate transport system permease protein PstA n=1 Tax=Natranaerobius thermophilus (strain ATCC BAA-1301 / DSM 18059 / JW/NM-WN-LF) TaxID=457570 RepID=B2A0K4_NATTJ|nr:phosphate ABC transporter permease PstA [Natranaerobius thermophilus]ACB84565.1 phosphate ABC transporter, inner membrane subunit PstA [Natranaerobius thermophilus JW/NM-WN-LF]